MSRKPSEKVYVSRDLRPTPERRAMQDITRVRHVDEEGVIHWLWKSQSEAPLDRLLRLGSIDDRKRLAGQYYFNAFTLAGYDTDNWATPNSEVIDCVEGGGGIDSRLHWRGQIARVEKMFDPEARSALWHVCGREISIRHWTEMCQVGQVQGIGAIRAEEGKGILGTALGVLAFHYKIPG